MRWPVQLAVVWPTSRAGCAQGLVTSVPIPRTMGTSSPLDWLVALCEDHSGATITTGRDLGDEIGGYGGPDDVVAAVVLAADAVELLVVDGVGHTYGRLQLGAAGNTLGHRSHLRVIGVFNRIVVKTGRTPLYPPREGARPWTGTQWHAMENLVLDTNLIHWTRMDSNGLPTVENLVHFGGQ